MKKTVRFRLLLGAPRRFARRRGFGIHSPFAFDFVRRVISQPCGFYCYPELDAAARECGIRRRVLRLIFRVALFFRPSQVLVFSGCGDAVRKAVDAAGGSGDGPRLAVVSRTLEARELESVREIAQTGGVVLFTGLRRDQTPARDIWLSACHGMMFRGGDVAVYVGLDHLPRQSFDLWI